MNLKDSKTFDFEGPLPSSKSLVNRALLLKAALGDETFLSFKWSSKALDVVLLNEALKTYKVSKSFEVGQGGTTFRFLSVFLSSKPGQWLIHGDKALFKRPQEDLFNFFKSQQVEYELTDSSLKIISKGWKKQKNIEVSSFTTTQVLTAVLLTSMSLKENFVIRVIGEQESDYFKLTLKFLSQIGFEHSFFKNELKVTSRTKLNNKVNIDICADWSTASFLFVLGALCGRTCVTNLSYQDGQPDSILLRILKTSGVDVDTKKDSVRFRHLASHTPQNINFKTHPDLFPVLSVFFAFVKGSSKLYGAPSLSHKETNRIDEMYKLLTLCGYKLEKLKDGVTVFGEGDCVLEHEPFDFDCSKDHRLYMAAYILKRKGYKISILGSESLNKSFPEFFDMVGDA